MKSVVSNNRFVIGDVVSWKSDSKSQCVAGVVGVQYSGAVVDIKVGDHDDLIIVRLANGQHRSFYDNATDVTFLNDHTTKWRTGW